MENEYSNESGENVGTRIWERREVDVLEKPNLLTALPPAGMRRLDLRVF